MEKRLVVRQGRPGTRRLLMITLFVAALLALSACGGDAPATEPAARRLTGEQVLRAMSEKLAKSQQLSFKVKRQLDAALIDGRELPESAQVEVSVWRPNRLLVKSTSGEGVRKFYADGKKVSLFDEGKKLYAVVPLTGTIDEMVNRIDDKFDFTPPLAEFALNDPYASISRHMENSSYKGMESVNGEDCHHVTATGALADADIWVASSDHLPRRLVATFKDREGSPQLKADFSEWNLKAKLEYRAFFLVPPEDAEKVEMINAVPFNEVERKGWLRKQETKR